jgi:predicted nicotinamide N-methyase
MAVGGPALIYYVSPTEEELFLKYNPELQERSLENRRQKQEDFDHFVGKLKEYSKSNKPSMSPSPFWAFYWNSLEWVGYWIGEDEMDMADLA